MAMDDLGSRGSFIHEFINLDLGENLNKIHTRFPPEPNGYLHIGHAKSICFNFGLAEFYKGKCNLRFDDTNPAKESDEYVKAIIEDIKWLGFDWEDRLFYASDYFDIFYDCAVKLIKKNKAYVCDLSAEEIKNYRGSLNEPGKLSPYRNRSVEENLDLFEKMKAGEFPDGSKTLRAKIDMNSPNINMRDPVIYRIARITHHNTKDKWCIYPMYDFAHPLEDAIEKITHSICTMEFEDHRPLYNWFVNECEFQEKPRQIEFAKLQLSRTIMGKRYMKELVEKKEVDGWDDPRLVTISGMRRRGYTPEAIKNFCEKIGVSKANSIVDISLLEHCVRDDLKLKSKMVMAILKPLKVVLLNYPEGQKEKLIIENNPEREDMGTREVVFSREIFIERDDFLEEAPKKFNRLTCSQEVRLKGAYFIKCEKVIKDDNGNIIELHCVYDPETRSGSGFSGRKVKGTIQWVSANKFINVSVRIYDYLLKENGEKNPDTLEIINNCVAEKEIENAKLGDKFQFMRHGYFTLDKKYSSRENLVFNKIIGLKSSYK